jgi:hypothetical protein
MPASFVAVVSEDGAKLHFDTPAAFREYVKKFAADEVVVTVKKRPRRQGNQAMRYYRGVVIPDIARACGHIDPDEFYEVHDALAWKFLRIEDSAFGTPRRRSTGKDDLAQDEMSKYIDDVITWAETSIPDCRVRRSEEVDMDTVIDPGWD